MAQKNAPQAETLYGLPQPLMNGIFPDIIAKRAPTALDTGYPIGQVWIFKGQDAYILVGVAAGVATWISTTIGASAVFTINGMSPVAGDIEIVGTSNEITLTNAGHTATLSIPTTFIAPGSIASTTTIHSGTALSSATTITAGTGITSTTGNITATAGNLVATVGSLALNGAASKIVINAGTPASASVGTTAAMTAGTITVTTSASTVASIIFASANTLGGTPGTLSVPQATVAAGSFVITSSSNADTSTVNYVIIN